MEDAAAVKVVKALEELFSKVFLMGVFQSEGRVIEKTGKIMGKVFENHVAIVLFYHHLLQLHDVVMVQRLE